MSSTPQIEDGYLMIANELLEAILGFGFSLREQSVLLTIIRKTYGYKKKVDDLSASQIGAMCRVPRQHVTTTLNMLALRNVITKKPGRYGSIIGIQKDHRKWITAERMRALPTCPESGQEGGHLDDEKEGNQPALLVPNQDTCPESGLVPNQDTPCPVSGQVDSPNSGHTKENLPKDNYQKKGPRQEITFKAWLKRCAEADQKPIPEDDPVFAYADEMKLPVDMVRFAWVEFKRKYGASNKRYKNWNQHFQNAIRENWYGIWFDKDGDWQLTTRGKQIEKELKAKQNEHE
jgi:phage replication O-like protein O